MNTKLKEEIEKEIKREYPWWEFGLQAEMVFNLTLRKARQQAFKDVETVINEINKKEIKFVDATCKKLTLSELKQKLEDLKCLT